ncbi:hypothetical protein [Marinomonas lutimaris]|uniref:hypothetical protein n=1 Tax=Marinomonas lutimaris TaxID=2846746 RepID=UPI001CA4DBBA|nr:hypothetical protein [Marinomonas lutimaris]
MTNVYTFTPRHELEYGKNLRDFIELAQKLPQLNDKYSYESNHWQGVGNFTNFGVSNQDRDPANVFDDSLLPFAKAYVTYGVSTKAGLSVKLYALKAINAACVKLYGRVDVTSLTSTEFDLAAEVIRGSIGAGAAYQAGRGLKNLLVFLIDHKMIARFMWKSPINKPAENATGDEGDKRRQSKMPDERALIALAEISASKNEDLSPRDVFTVSTMTLLLSAPARGSEPLYLSANCLHEEKMKSSRALALGLSEKDIEQLKKWCVEEDKGQLINDFEEKVTLKGLRWYSGKSYGHENKWLPTVMLEVVTTAVERLKALSEDARNFAKALENSPSFPRHHLCPDVADDTMLTMDEAALALGLDLSSYEDRNQMRTSRNQLLRRKGIERSDYQVNLHDLNKIIRRDLPEGFPYISFKKGEGNVKLKWSDALYAGFKNSLDAKKNTLYTELFIPTINTLNEDLAPSKKINRSTGGLAFNDLSVFQRWEYGDLSLTSHQLRHMLDTMAAVNGMDGELRAKWAQRSDPKHNRYYNHTTSEEYGADFIEDREKELALRDQNTKIQIQVQVANPRTIQELNTKASLTTHTTEFGMCVTSYLSEPCTKFKDCINCNEHVCIKGDDDKCDRIRRRLELEKKVLQKDKKAVDDKVQGAEQWYQRRKITAERLEQLLTLMESPDIENGSLIKLSNVEDITQLDRAMIANGVKRLPKITNFKRIQTVTLDHLIGQNSNHTPDESAFDDLDSLEGLDYMLEDES